MLRESENSGSIQESSLGCMLDIVLCIKKLHLISWNWRKEKSTAACGFSPIKIHYSDYPKRINEVYVFSNEITLLSLPSCERNRLLEIQNFFIFFFFKMYLFHLTLMSSCARR